MTDDHDPELDPELDPTEEARIRALLADLGEAPEAAATPPDVAARLDETRAGRVAERAEPEDEAPAVVVPLRRRWTSRAAVAAAAVIVIGAGGVAAANLGLFGGESDSMTSAGGASSSKTESQDDSGSAPSPSTPPGTSSGLLARDLPRLSAASFGADVKPLVESPQELRANQRKAAEDSAGGDTAAVGGCPGPSVGAGAQHLVVLYDGSPAALVVRPEQGGERLVEAWTCSGDRRLDSATVPVGVPTPGKSDSD